jgi:hypothetical protein
MEMFSLLWTQVKWVKNLLTFKQGVFEIIKKFCISKSYLQIQI